MANLSYDEMVAVIEKGESVLHDNVIYSRVEDLPNPGSLALASGDKAKVEEVRSGMEAQIQLLQAQLKQLEDGPKEGEVFDPSTAPYSILSSQAAQDGYDFTKFGRTMPSIRQWYADGKPEPKVRDATTTVPVNPEGMGQTVADVGQPGVDQQAPQSVGQVVLPNAL
jgi:hypothetical protein